MLLQDIPIDSQEPSAVTISKALGKIEKTIRTHRDKAFATLRLRLERKETVMTKRSPISSEDVMNAFAMGISTQATVLLNVARPV